jgi:hypothetical protein
LRLPAAGRSYDVLYWRPGSQQLQHGLGLEVQQLSLGRSALLFWRLLAQALLIE